ncbi:NAD(P)-binding protein [Aaosphaeria arxii CBS 175.79]|uniref:NAD(P)-binding protein n=1 Tax=Aaosphaeria arxii CBS 175.79 TaxID=1450172 RepID=A0A6A5XQR6_9PLEO|nr:NAD(P)-binding protein [Aaosphaeria arxii CBS 175.79]KAF2015618.1 NAD(P)-binding protein [Aaosphaeria arxii CBS 175.79]
MTASASDDAAAGGGGGKRQKTAGNFSVRGKRAIVTGAGSGINFSFAALLLSRGCSVLIADIALRPEAKELVEKYSAGGDKKEGEARAVFQETDVTQWTQLERMFEVAQREFGGVDVVCPGAGIYDPHWSNFWHPPGSAKSRDALDGNRYASVDINITHPIRSTQLAISEFLNPSSTSGEGGEEEEKASPQNPKRVVIISSIAGQTSNLNTPIYVATKHAMNGFIRSLAPLEARTGIRVNGVAPGVIKTPLWFEHPEKMGFLDESKDEWATPEEVAEAMLRCVEDEDMAGGTILEVGARQTRKVQQLNDPGPSGPGHTVANLEASYEEVFEWLGEEGWGTRKK